MNKGIFGLLIAATTVSLGGRAALAQWWEQEAKLTAGDGAAGDNFGRFVSVSGDWAVVGAFLDDNVNGTEAGAAYVFQRSGSAWTQRAKLIASDGTSGDRFGVCVSIDGDRAVVGAYWDDENGTYSGSAYVFERNGPTWAQVAKLTPSDLAAGDKFGFSVSISGDYVVAGSMLDDDLGADSGSAYVFRRTGTAWVQDAKLNANDEAEGDWFGYATCIRGDDLLLGAVRDDDNGFDSGSAYVFRRNGSEWMQVAKLISGDGADVDCFATDVSICGDFALIGARADDDNGHDSGSAYVFERQGSTWTQAAKLVAGDGAADDYFGRGVAIHGDWALIGAHGDDDNGPDSGSAYVFQREGSAWSQVVKLTPDDAAADDWFGWRVAMDGEAALIGAVESDPYGTDSGAAYVYRIPEPATLSLLAAAGWALLRRRRRSARPGGGRMGRASSPPLCP